MARIIKVRGWDEENKKMLAPIDLSTPRKTWMWLGEFDVPLMQFTGFKDKNGKEIYEGDLVKHVICCRKHDSIHEGSGDVFQVKIGKQILPFGDQDQGATYLDEFNYEVIGNIYENPELLKT